MRTFSVQARILCVCLVLLFPSALNLQYQLLSKKDARVFLCQMRLLQRSLEYLIGRCFYQRNDYGAAVFRGQGLNKQCSDFCEIFVSSNVSMIRVSSRCITKLLCAKNVERRGYLLVHCGHAEAVFLSVTCFCFMIIRSFEYPAFFYGLIKVSARSNYFLEI